MLHLVVCAGAKYHAAQDSPWRVSLEPGRCRHGVANGARELYLFTALVCLLPVAVGCTLDYSPMMHYFFCKCRPKRVAVGTHKQSSCRYHFNEIIIKNKIQEISHPC
jgi:hypothetical protein